jgi:signal transduction histidine kinase
MLPATELKHNIQFVKFEIEDSGLGIPEDKINTIFNLFEYEFMTLNTIN